MSKYVYVMAILFVFISTLKAQMYINTQEDTLDMGQSEMIQDMVVDNSSNKYVIGTIPYTALLKLDNNNAIEWTTTLQTGFNPKALVLANNSIYIAGSVQDTAGTSLYTAKYDTLGNFLSGYAIPLDQQGEFYSIEKDISGNIYALGYGLVQHPSDSDYDLIIARLDPDLNVLLVDTIDFGSWDYGTAVGVNANDEIFIGGYSYIGGNFDRIVIKMDTSGNIMWTDTIDNGNHDFVFGLVVDNAGNPAVTGYSSINYQNQILTTKYNTDGDLLWVDTFALNNTDARKIATDGSNIYVAGFSNDMNNSYDMFVFKLSPSGDRVWSSIIDRSPTTEQAMGLCVDENQNIILGGHFIPPGNVLYDLLFITYSKNIDAQITAITSPDTAYFDSTYVPTATIFNASYEDSIDITVIATIDTDNVIVYTDTLTVTGIPDSSQQNIVFSPWTPDFLLRSANLQVAILTSDIDTSNNTLSKSIYVNPMAQISDNGSQNNKPSFLKLSSLKGKLFITLNTLSRKNELLVLSSEGRVIKRFSSLPPGMHELSIPLSHNGVYYIILKDGEKLLKRKSILIK